MHFILGVITVLAAWKYGDWKNWQRYHPAMMFIVIGNLLYNVLTARHFLWKLKPDLMPNHSLTELVYTFVIFPATALMFISNYPKPYGKIIVHYLRYIGVYVAVEWFFMRTDRIVYQYGWNIYWSIFFNFTMFPLLWTFHKKPLVAYGITLVLVVFYVWYFKIPVNIPVEQRP